MYLSHYKLTTILSLEENRGIYKSGKFKEELTQIWLPMDLLNHYGRTGSDWNAVSNQIHLTISTG